MKYNFDELIDRTNTNSMKVSGFRDYLFPNNPNIEIPYTDDELVKMWIADMEFAVPDVILNAIHKRLDSRILGYTKIFDNGYYEAFVNWCKDKYDFTFKKDDLFTSHGVVPALNELVGLMCDENEKVVFCTPSYAYFEKAAIVNNREYYTSSLIKVGDKFTFNFEQIEKYCQDPLAKIFILCNPHNPSGIVWSEDELKRIGEICLENDMWIISDEIHCDLLRTGISHTPIKKLFKNTTKIVTCMAPSKTFNIAGLMLSNIIIEDDDLKEKWKNHHTLMENPLSIVANQAAYSSGDEWLSQMKVYLDENFAYLKRFLDTNLPKTNYIIPDATYLAWVDVSNYVDTNQDLTAFFAQKAGVLLESGTQFVADGKGYIRLNLACPRSILIKALDQIYSVLK